MNNFFVIKKIGGWFAFGVCATINQAPRKKFNFETTYFIIAFENERLESATCSAAAIVIISD